MSVPMSFDFFGAIKPDYVVKCSYGNDSIALIQFLHEWVSDLGKVVILYNDTGWASKWWEARVSQGETLARNYGFIPARTQSIGMKELVWRHNGWPDDQQRFCTRELKIIPTLNWLSVNDPEGLATMVCGVRREESFNRRNWPEWAEASPKNDGRSEWAPLVYLTAQERDKLIVRAGWTPLAHRSRECRCINGNAADLATWSEDDICEIEAIEARMKVANPGKIKTMFRPKKNGQESGIRDQVQWAKGVVARREEKLIMAGCDSGFCEA